jgi:hypothetical protein
VYPTELFIPSLASRFGGEICDTASTTDLDQALTAAFKRVTGEDHQSCNVGLMSLSPPPEQRSAEPPSYSQIARTSPAHPSPQRAIHPLPQNHTHDRDPLRRVTRSLPDRPMNTATMLMLRKWEQEQEANQRFLNTKFCLTPQPQQKDIGSRLRLAQTIATLPQISENTDRSLLPKPLARTPKPSSPPDSSSP